MGGGSAGTVLASRLSEDPGCRVLLLEAGPDIDPERPPEGLYDPDASRMLSHAEHSWGGLRVRRSPAQDPQPYVQARGVGGGSLVNSMFAMRGTPADFDGWAKAGCSGWSHAELLDAFVRLESDLDFGAAPHHGSSGPMPVSRASEERWGPVDEALAETATRLGVPSSPDLNAPDSTGLSGMPATLRGERRVTTTAAYLAAERGRPNLEVRPHVLVDRVSFDGERADGVVWLETSGERVAHAGRVVLCAGAFGSAAILQRSGIGPAEDLRRLGIPLRVPNDAVGANLSDHPAIPIVMPLRREARESLRQSNCCVRESSGGADALRNDLMFFASNFAPYSTRNVGFVFVCLMQVFSKGRVRLTSQSPFEHPSVELCMLEDERDLARLAIGVGRLIEFGRGTAFGKIAEQKWLGSSRPPPGQLRSWLRRQAMSIHHPCGTCRMGGEGDPRTVVLPDCSVVGTEGLFVVDASIMPEIPSANPHLTVIALAEHAARSLSTCASGGAGRPARVHAH